MNAESRNPTPIAGDRIPETKSFGGDLEVNGIIIPLFIQPLSSITHPILHQHWPSGIVAALLSGGPNHG